VARAASYNCNTIPCIFTGWDSPRIDEGGPGMREAGGSGEPHLQLQYNTLYLLQGGTPPGLMREVLGCVRRGGVESPAYNYSTIPCIYYRAGFPRVDEGGLGMREVGWRGEQYSTVCLYRAGLPQV
jgi:hypothetical protein